MATTAKKTTAAPAAAEKPAEKAPAKPKADLGQAEVQAIFDEANEKGYFGHTPDETPNGNYTLAGVVANKPTPENQRGKK